MNTLQLQLNKKIAALSAELPYEYSAVRVLSVAVGILIFVYLYLVSASVLNVIAQRESDQASAAHESKIGVLEGKYFTLSKNITPAHASELGLKPVTDTSFVYKLETVGFSPAAKNAI